RAAARTARGRRGFRLVARGEEEDTHHDGPSHGRPYTSRDPERSLDLQDREERLLRDLDAPDHLHAPLAFLLLLEKLALAADVAAVAFRGDVLAHRLHGRARDDLRTDRRLDGDLVLLARHDVLELDGEIAPSRVRLLAVNDDAERVERLAV